MRAGLTLAGALAGLLAMEIVLRVVGVEYPIFHAWDERLGWSPIPGAEGIYTDEGRGHVRINGAGFRDREHAREKPRGTLRVAVLGDSYTEAFPLDLEQTYWSVLERSLAGCDVLRGRGVEVLNFGVYAYGTAQELLLLRERVWPYEPDLVLLLFTTGNDVTDNSRRLRGDPTRPYFVERDGELVLDDSFRREGPYRTSAPVQLYYRVLARSRVLQMLHALRGRLIYRADAPRDPLAQREQDLVGGIRSELAFREPTGAAGEEAWRITERLLAAIATEVRSRGARFVLATGTNPIQVHPDRAQREAQQRSYGVPDLFYSDRRLAALGAREGFAVVHVAPALGRYVDETGQPVHGFDGSGGGHWNATGHRLAGERIADELCRRVLAP